MKKILTAIFMSIFIIAFSHHAQAYIEDEWAMDIVEKIKAKVKGVGKYKDTDSFSDNWSFSSDNTFSIDGYKVGTWEIIGKKFYVYIDEETISDILEQKLIDNANFPLDTTVSIYDAQAFGKHKKDGSIKAKYKFKAIVEVSGFTGKLNVKGKATGIKISDNPENESNQSPVISNLFFSPESVNVGQGEIVTVNVNIDFSDAEGDITTLRVSSAGVMDVTTPITGMNGQTSGTINGVITFLADTAGTYPFEIWVIDSEGHSSNKLEGSFEIVIDNMSEPDSDVDPPTPEPTDPDITDPPDYVPPSDPDSNPNGPDYVPPDSDPNGPDYVPPDSDSGSPTP